jgi:Aerobic-type carbon monoxide dehydrogenase, small subunit CoxS/CutS homologs
VRTAAKLIVVEIRELLVDGLPTKHRVVGAGKTLVLVHGLSGSWRWWEPVLEPLAERDVFTCSTCPGWVGDFPPPS